MLLPATTCYYLLRPVTTRNYLSLLVITCYYLLLPAITCYYLLLPVHYTRLPAIIYYLRFQIARLTSYQRLEI